MFSGTKEEEQGHLFIQRIVFPALYFLFLEEDVLLKEMKSSWSF